MTGYSRTPLAKKLGIKDRSEIVAFDAPSDYAKLLVPLPSGAKIAARRAASTDIARAFVTRTADTVREVALPLGLVDIKVRAVDDVWSGLKLVIRKELR